MPAEHWRMQRKRYRLEGFKREKGDGTVEFSLNGSNWTESPNGYHRDENPLEGDEALHQADRKASDNGREPIKVYGTVEISASKA